MSKPTYSQTNGIKLTSAQIDRYINKAGRTLLELQFLEHGYNFCSKCNRNDCKPIDVSHNISRKKAKEDGNVEILWDLDNLEILGRKCHQQKDKLNLKF